MNPIPGISDIYFHVIQEKIKIKKFRKTISLLPFTITPFPSFPNYTFSYMQANENQA